MWKTKIARATTADSLMPMMPSTAKVPSTPIVAPKTSSPPHKL